MLHNSFSEEIFPNTQIIPPLVQLKAIFSYHLLLGMREMDPYLAIAFFREERDEKQGFP